MENCQLGTVNVIDRNIADITEQVRSTRGKGHFKGAL